MVKCPLFLQPGARFIFSPLPPQAFLVLHLNVSICIFTLSFLIVNEESKKMNFKSLLWALGSFAEQFLQFYFDILRQNNYQMIMKIYHHHHHINHHMYQ